MKFLVILATYISSFAAISAQATLSMISDIDDTIKITNVNAIPKAAARGPLGTAEFLGMSVLYRSLLTMEPEAKIYYVSGSPRFLTKSVQHFLEKNHYPKGELYLRDKFARPEIYIHKVNRIEKILSANRQDQFLLIGDDTERDHEVFHFIQNKHAERIVVAYVHLVRNDRLLPDSVVGYFNAADLAMHELIAGRISVEQAQTIMQLFLDTPLDEDELLPEFASCPSDGWLSKLVSEQPIPSNIRAMAAPIEEKIRIKCELNRDDD